MEEDGDTAPFYTSYGEVGEKIKFQVLNPTARGKKGQAGKNKVSKPVEVEAPVVPQAVLQPRKVETPVTVEDEADESVDDLPSHPPSGGASAYSRRVSRKSTVLVGGKKASGGVRKPSVAQ